MRAHAGTQHLVVVGIDAARREQHDFDAGRGRRAQDRAHVARIAQRVEDQHALRSAGQARRRQRKDGDNALRLFGGADMVDDFGRGIEREFGRKLQRGDVDGSGIVEDEIRQIARLDRVANSRTPSSATLPNLRRDFEPAISPNASLTRSFCRLVIMGKRLAFSNQLNTDVCSVAKTTKAHSVRPETTLE